MHQEKKQGALFIVTTLGETWRRADLPQGPCAFSYFLILFYFIAFHCISLHIITYHYLSLHIHFFSPFLLPTPHDLVQIRRTALDQHPNGPRGDLPQAGGESANRVLREGGGQGSTRSVLGGPCCYYVLQPHLDAAETQSRHLLSRIVQGWPAMLL